MGTTQLVIGLTVTVAGLVAAMSVLLIVSRLVDLASRRREASSAGVMEAQDAAGSVTCARTTVGARPGPRQAVHRGPGDRTIEGARTGATTGVSSQEGPARSRSLHLRLRVAGKDYDVEVQPVGQAA